MAPMIYSRDMYMRHREKVLSATTEIDSSPPKLQIYTFLKYTKRKEDANRHEQVMKENNGLQVKINTIMRSYGTIKSCREEILSARKPLRAAIEKLREMEKQNEFLGRRVLCVKPEIQTHRPPDDTVKKHKRKKSRFEMPNVVLSKYAQLKLPADHKELRKLLRPRIYFDLAIIGSLPLGRITIQLFTEACPQVVLEFVRACKSTDTSRLSITHLFPNLWLEGELQLLGKLNTSLIEYDMRALDHNKSAGVLSFPRRHLKGFRDSVIDFAVSFRPLNVLNGKRVAFGVVQHGRRLLASLQAYGTKNGKPLKDIIVTECGAL